MISPVNSGGRTVPRGIRLAALLAVFFTALPVHADWRPGLQRGMHLNATEHQPGYFEQSFAKANGPTSPPGESAPADWAPVLGEAPGVSHGTPRYKLTVNRGLSLPDSVFSNRHVGGVALDLDNGTTLFPQSVTLMAGAMPESGSDGAGNAGYTTGLAWQSRYHGNDSLGLSFFYSKGAGLGSSGQWLSSLRSQMTPLPNLTGITLDAEVAALQPQNSAMTGLAATGARIRLASPGGSPVQYNLTLARYGAGFQPLGSLVTADWEGVSASASYHFSSDMQLDAHTDYGRQNFGSSDPQLIRAANINLSGHVFHALTPSLASALKNRIQGGSAAGGPVVDSLRYMMMVLAQPVWGGWDYRFGMTVQQQEDVLSNRSTISRGFHVAGNHPLNLGGVLGSIGPGFAWRNYTGSPLQDSFEAGVAFNLKEHSHHLALDVGYLSQNWAGAAGEQNAVKFMLNYRLTFDTPTALAALSPAWYTPDGSGF